jgi:Protein of unknown function (DUF3047)
MRMSVSRSAAASVLAAAALLAACSSPPQTPVTADGAALLEGALAPERDWQPYVLPGKRATQYRFTSKDGQWAIEARADASASMLRRKLDMPSDALSDVTWSWWVEAPLADADLADVDRSDAPAQLVLAFDGDKSRLSARTRMMFELARTLGGEEPPYATLVYAWSTQAPTESVVNNPRSDRIRKIVVDTGSAQTQRWRHHRRNVVADYRKAFGEEPGRLIAVGVFTDADNTRSKARAWYGPIKFHPPTAGRSAVPAAAPQCVPSAGKSCSSANN